MKESDLQVNYYVSADGDTRKSYEHNPDRNIIGNSFATSEEAEVVVEKLKALKRLKDAGFKFCGRIYEGKNHFGSAFFQTSDRLYSIYEDVVDFYDDLDLLFGEEK